MTLIDHVERGKDLRRPVSGTADDYDLLIDSTRAVEPLDRISLWDTGVHRTRTASRSTAGGAFGSFRRPCPFATRQYSVRTFRSYSRDDLLQRDRKLVRVERSSFPYFFPWRRDFIPGVHTQIILFFTTETRSTYIDLSEFVALAVASIQLNCFLFLASSYRQFARQRVSAEFRRRV